MSANESRLYSFYSDDRKFPELTLLGLEFWNAGNVREKSSLVIITPDNWFLIILLDTSKI